MKHIIINTIIAFSIGYTIGDIFRILVKIIKNNKKQK